VRYRRRLITIVAALVALSIYQYIDTGKVGWVADLRASIEQYLNRPEASWRKASDTLNDFVPAQGAPGTFDIRGRVVRVADADTISVLDKNNKQFKVRFFGVDAPERDQPHGREAANALSAMLAGKNVGIVTKDTDQYDRTLGVVYLNGANVNLELVLSGHAWWYKHFAGYDRDLQAAEQKARRAQRGLWQQANPIPPWEWRRGKR
jgi:endonuclease YncB( thermonuclease family)